MRSFWKRRYFWRLRRRRKRSWRGKGRERPKRRAAAAVTAETTAKMIMHLEREGRRGEGKGVW